jgi:exoribonuclease R
LLTRASLTTVGGAHMGMALPAYTNCTSPLRKYADLLVHRQLKALLRDQVDTGIEQGVLDGLSQSIQTARDACIYAERWLAANYLKKLTGFKRQVSLSAVVAQISSSGFIARLTDSGLEGFVDLRKDPEKFSFDKWTASLTSTTRRFQLAQEVAVYCVGFDPKTRVINFDLVPDCGLKTAG